MYHYNKGDFADLVIEKNAIREAVKQNIEEPIKSLTKNEHLTYKIADQIIQLVNDYVPMDTGDLRSSAHIVQHARQTRVIYGDSHWGTTKIYAPVQYAPDEFKFDYKNYTEPGTGPYWLEEIEPGGMKYQELVDYASKLLRKAVRKKNG